MNTWIRNNAKTVFTGFLVSVVLVFFWLRPLNSPWHPFIAGDGLGYYSYLPAQFIYNDHDFSFYWFNKAHNANYVYSTFDNPEDNLLVEYHGKKINKYYQGLSFIWLPFFLVAHIIAKVSAFPADGFSLPYQWAIGFASLVYLLLGLYYLKKLLQKLFHDELASIIVTAIIFYGTHLFTYSISANSLSHAYSFTFIVLFLYHLVSFSDQRTPEEERSTKAMHHLLLALLFLAITVAIRPLNGLIILMAPVLIGERNVFKTMNFKSWSRRDLLVAGLIIITIVYVCRINFIQTGSIFTYTYSNERFYFNRPQFLEALFSFHNGLFVYVPCIFISLGGIPFLNKRMRIAVPLFFFAIVFLYSCWWFWPITKRALVDYYSLPAIMLAALIHHFSVKSSAKVIIVLSILSVIYYQFKSWQIRKGILDENATYSEVFWRNFFRTEKANMYLIPPSTILESEEHLLDFENQGDENLSTDRAYSGKRALLIDSSRYIADVANYLYPALFKSKDFKKIRFSFRCYFTNEVKQTHGFFRFFDKQNKEILSVPFYLNPEDLLREKWDLKEFGYEISDTALVNNRTVNKIMFTIWNVAGKGEIYIDNARTEFIITGSSFETINK
jgi:hypothetical protein